MAKESIGTRIKRRREKLGIRPVDLVSRAKLPNHATLSNLERGAVQTSDARTLAKIAKALECRLEWLVTGDLPETEIRLSQGAVDLLELYEAAQEPVKEQILGSAHLMVRLAEEAKGRKLTGAQVAEVLSSPPKKP